MSVHANFFPPLFVPFFFLYLFQHAGQCLVVLKCLRLPLIADIDDLALVVTEGEGGGMKGSGGGSKGGRRRRGRRRREGGGKKASFLGGPV